MLRNVSAIVLDRSYRGGALIPGLWGERNMNNHYGLFRWPSRTCPSFLGLLSTSSSLGAFWCPFLLYLFSFESSLWVFTNRKDMELTQAPQHWVRQSPNKHHFTGTGWVPRKQSAWFLRSGWVSGKHRLKDRSYNTLHEQYAFGMRRKDFGKGTPEGGVLGCGGEPW